MGKPLNVCHVLTSLEIGGMERMVCMLMQAQSSLGLTPSLFCTDVEGDFFSGCAAAAKACGGRRKCPLVVDWRVVHRLATFAREQRVDVLHAHNPAGQLYSVLASRRLGVPVLVTYHGQAFQETMKLRCYRRVLCWLTEAVVAISRDVGTRLVDLHVAPAKRVHVVRNGISTQSVAVPDSSDARGELGIPGNVFVVGSVGRLSHEKNYSLLLRSIVRMRELSADSGSHDHDDVVALLVGDGPDRPVLEALVDELGIGANVRFAGARDDVDRWLGAMDVFCLSSMSEGTSIALLEAAARGLPAVVTDAGGNSEVVKDGVSGFVTPLSDVEAFATALLRMRGDAVLRNKMGAAAREHIAEAYSLGNMAQHYSQLYHRILGLP